MNKTIIILLLVAAAAFSLQFFGVFNITEAITNLPNTISSGASSFISNPTEFIKTNADLIKGIGGSLTIATPIFGFLYSKLKSDTTQAIKQEQAIRLEQGQELLSLQTQQETALNQIEALKKERDEAVAKAETATSDAQKQIKTLQSQVGQLENEKNEIKRMFNYVDDKIEITRKPEPIP